jgi:hypothetical protein
MAAENVIASPVIEVTLDTTKFTAQMALLRSQLSAQAQTIQSSVSSSLSKINSTSLGGMQRSFTKSFNAVAYGAIRMGKQVEQALKIAIVPAAALATKAFMAFYKSNTQAGDSFREQFNPVKKELETATTRIGSFVAKSKIFGKTIVEWTSTAATALNKLTAQDIQKFISAISNGLRIILMLKTAIIGLRFTAGFLKTIEAISKFGAAKGVMDVVSTGGAGTAAAVAAAGGGTAAAIGGTAAAIGGTAAASSAAATARATAAATARATAATARATAAAARTTAAAARTTAAAAAAAAATARASMGSGTSYAEMAAARSVAARAIWAGRAASRTATAAATASAAAAAESRTTAAAAAAAAAAGGAGASMLSKIGSILAKFGPWILVIGGAFNLIGKSFDRLSGMVSESTSGLSRVLEILGNSFNFTFSFIGSFFDRLMNIAEDNADSLTSKQLGFGMLLPRIIKDMQDTYEEAARPENLKGGEYISEKQGVKMGLNKGQIEAYNAKLKKSYTQRENEINVPIEDAKKRLESTRTAWTKKLNTIGIIESDINQEFDNYVKGVALETGKSEEEIRKNIPKIKQQAVNKTWAEFPEIGMPPTTSKEVRAKVEEQLSIFGKAIEDAKIKGKLGLPEKMINEMQETLDKLYDVYHAHMMNLKGEIESSKEYSQNKERYTKSIKEKTYKINELQDDEVVKGKDWIRNWTKRKDDFDNLVRELGGGTRKYKDGKYIGTEVTSSDRSKVMTLMGQLIIDRQEKMGKLGYTGEAFGFAETEKFAGDIRKKGKEKQEEIAQKMLEAEQSLVEATFDNNDKTKENSEIILKLKEELVNTVKAFKIFVDLVKGGMPAGQAGGYAPIP